MSWLIVRIVVDVIPILDVHEDVRFIWIHRVLVIFKECILLGPLDWLCLRLLLISRRLLLLFLLSSRLLVGGLLGGSGLLKVYNLFDKMRLVERLVVNGGPVKAVEVIVVRAGLQVSSGLGQRSMQMRGLVPVGQVPVIIVVINRRLIMMLRGEMMTVELMFSLRKSTLMVMSVPSVDIVCMIRLQICVTGRMLIMRIIWKHDNIPMTVMIVIIVR